MKSAGMFGRALLAIAAAVIVASAPARRCAAAEDAHAEAVRAFEQANTHYDLGEYDQAIPLFRRAYEISREPALIFNIAQAYRLSGDCHRAIEAYRQFLRLSSDPGLRATAEGHSETLRRSCPAAAAAPAGAGGAEAGVATGGGAGSGEAAAQEAGRWRTVSVVAMGAGLVSGAVATGLHLANNARYDLWEKENQYLKTMTDVARQDANDARWRTIERTDRIVTGLAITGAVLLVAGGVYWFITRPADRSTSLSFSGTGATGTIRWR